MSRPSYWSGFVITRPASSVDDLEVLIVDVQSLDAYHIDKRPAPKFPGGMNKPQDGYDPVKTAMRELREETGLSLKQSARPVELLRTDKWKLPSHTTGDSGDDLSPPAQSEILLWFVVVAGECEGLLHTEPVVGENTVTSPPYWVSVGELRRKSGKLWSSHAPALERLVNRFARLQGLQS